MVMIATAAHQGEDHSQEAYQGAVRAVLKTLVIICMSQGYHLVSQKESLRSILLLRERLRISILSLIHGLGNLEGLALSQCRIWMKQTAVSSISTVRSLRAVLLLLRSLCDSRVGVSQLFSKLRHNKPNQIKSQQISDCYRAKRARGRTPTPGRYLGLRTARAGRRRTPSYSPLPSDRERSYSRSPYYYRRDRSYSPYYRSRGASHYSRSPDRRRSRYDSPADRYYRRSRYRSPSPRPIRSSRRQRSYSRSYSPRPSRRSYRRSYSRSYSPRPSRRSYSRSYSPKPRRSSRRRRSPSGGSYSPEPRRGRSYSKSLSPRPSKSDVKSAHNSPDGRGPSRSSRSYSIRSAPSRSRSRSRSSTPSAARSVSRSASPSA